MKKLSVIFVVLLFLASGIFAQKSESNKTVKENGWNLTSVQNLFEEKSQIINRKRMYYTKTHDIEVDIHSLRISRKVVFDVKDFFNEKKLQTGAIQLHHTFMA